MKHTIETLTKCYVIDLHEGTSFLKLFKEDN
jgi:hypothetical protein